MLEILVLIMLTKKIGAIVREKGRTAGGYQALTVLLWIGGEITGIVIGISNDMGNGAYLLAIMGAATGAFIAYLIAASVKPLYQVPPQVGQIFE